MSFRSCPPAVCSFVFLTVAACFVAPSAATAGGRETLSNNEAARLGMVAAWNRQLSMSGGLDGLVDAELFVDTEKKKQFVELVADGKVLFRLSADQLNQFGMPIGIEEAQRLAKIETYRLKRRGIDAATEIQEVPTVLLYALGADGTIECRDAETGQLNWVKRYGNPMIDCMPMAINDQYVCFSNANRLFVLNAGDGNLVRELKLDVVPMFGPTLVGEYVMCISAKGRITGYWLKDLEREPFVTRSAGSPLAAPVTDASASRTLWPSDRDFIFALDGAGSAELTFRFPTTGSVTSSVASSSQGKFFAATDMGVVYGLSATETGKLMWRQGLGEPIYRSPQVIGDHVYVRTVYGHLNCLDAKDGSITWLNPVERVERILGGDQGQVLVRLTSAQLASVDVESGAILVNLPATSVVGAITNPLTDRLYLLTSNGAVQCLRPVASELPKFMSIDFSSQPVDPLEAAAEDTQGKPNTNPFGFGNENADPFGGGAGAGDPFGNGGNDPFGGAGGAGGGNDDPFGGAPFGN